MPVFLRCASAAVLPATGTDNTCSNLSVSSRSWRTGRTSRRTIAQLHTDAANRPIITILTTIWALLKSQTERSTAMSGGFMMAPWQ